MERRLNNVSYLFQSNKANRVRTWRLLRPSWVGNRMSFETDSATGSEARLFVLSSRMLTLIVSLAAGRMNLMEV